MNSLDEHQQSKEMHPFENSQLSDSVPVNGNNDEEAKIQEEMAQVMKGLQEVAHGDFDHQNSRIKVETDNSNGENHLKRHEEMNGEGEEGPTPPKKPHVQMTVRQLLPELEKYWKPVEQDSNDFQAWAYLLQYVDQENEVLAAREAYDSFLAKYPYCYGYWKKYAEYERKKGSPEDCEKVFQQGLKAIPLSVDLWIHYLNYVKAAHSENADYVQEQFERALQVVGLEFRSDKLWDLYVHYMKEKGNLRYILTIYDRVLAIPTQCSSQHLQNLKLLINSYSPQEVLSTEELEEISDVAKAAASVDAESEEALEERTVAKIREIVLDRRADLYKMTEAEIKARWPFEEAIKRPYFHVKPLEKGQLKNWKEYLDFEISRGDEARIIVLFERCLIACALYEEYWIRYIRYLQSHGDKYIEKLRDVFARACLTHHSGKLNVNLHWAAFEESKGNFDEAADVLDRLDKHVPHSLLVWLRRINLERRRGNMDACEKLFEKYIADENNKDTVGHLKIKYARFLARWRKNFDQAKNVLKNAAEENENTRAKIIMALIDLHLDQTPVDFEAVVACFNDVLESKIPNEQKVTFAHRKIEFLEDYGSDMLSVERAEEQLQSIAKAMRDKAAGSNATSAADVTTSDGHAYGENGTFSQPNSQSQGYSQYGQYSNWNYQQSAGYGYQQGWSAYGGYYG